MNVLPSCQPQVQACVDLVQTQIYLLSLSPEALGDSALSDSYSILQLAIEILKAVGDTLGTVLLMYLFLFYLLMIETPFPGLSNNGQLLQDRARNARRIGRPHAADDIVDLYWSL